MPHSPKIVRSVLAIVLFASAAFLPPLLRSVSRKPPNAEVAARLDAAKNEAYEVARDSDEMTALLRTDVSWQTHAEMIDRVREHVNNLGKIVEKLQSERDQASPWQQQAIDRMVPLLQELAANTTAAIEHLNQNKTRPLGEDYQNYLEQNADTAHDLADMISNFERYGRTRAELERLQDKIEAK